MSKIRELKKAIDGLGSVIQKTEYQMQYDKVLKEIPESTLSLFGREAREKFKSIYLDNRIAGKTEKQAHDISLRMVARAFRSNKMEIFKGINTTLTRIQKSLVTKAEEIDESVSEYGETAQDEFFAAAQDTEEEVIAPDEDSEQVEKALNRILKALEEDRDGTGPHGKGNGPGEGKGCEEDDIEKAEEGDTKMIFGKPATFTGGKWKVDADGDGKKDDDPEELVDDKGSEASTGNGSEREQRFSDRSDVEDILGDDAAEAGMDTKAYAQKYDEAIDNAMQDNDLMTQGFGEDWENTSDAGEREEFAANAVASMSPEEIASSGSDTGSDDIESTSDASSTSQRLNSELSGAAEAYQIEQLTGEIEKGGYDEDDIANMTIEDSDTGYGKEVNVGDDTYHIMTPEESEKFAQEHLQSVLDDMGTDGFQDWAVNDAIDEEALARDLSVDGDYDYGYDEPDNFLEEEPEGENGDWSEDQRRRAGDMADEAFIQRVTEDPMGYLEDMGTDPLEYAKENNYIDEQRLIEQSIMNDGADGITANALGADHLWDGVFRK